MAQRGYQDLETNYANILNAQQQPLMVAIYDKMNTNSPPTIDRWISFSPTPASAVTYNIPYLVNPTPLVNSTDLPIIDCDYEVELGATADAWRTKRQFSKADNFDRQFEEHIIHMIWAQENQPNKVVQFAPKTFDIDNNLY